MCKSLRAAGARKFVRPYDSSSAVAAAEALDVDTRPRRRRRRRRACQSHVRLSAEDTGAGALTPGMRQSMGAAGACFGGESEEQGARQGVMGGEPTMAPCKHSRLSSRTCRSRRAFESTPHSVALTQALSVGGACKCVRTREKESARTRLRERGREGVPAESCI